MTDRDKVLKDLFSQLKLDLWDSWDAAFRKAKRKGETDGYAVFLADSWVDFRERNMAELTRPFKA